MYTILVRVSVPVLAGWHPPTAELEHPKKLIQSTALPRERGLLCLNCHEQQWVDNFYVHYDSLLDLYHDKFAKPGLELYGLAKPLMSPVEFAG